MRVFLIKKKNAFFLIGIIGILLGAKCLWKAKEKVIETSSSLYTNCLIIDAGHGMPDGGAVSPSGVQEEAINLAISLKLKARLEELGYEVILTRETHENIADETRKGSIREIKQSDLENRVKIANQSGADFMISIHMNEFQQKSSWGWQTFFKKGSIEGEKLATSIQNGILQKIDRPNHRKAHAIENIKIIEKTFIPVVIVECGFLSNEEEERLLQEEDYQEKMVEGIVEGIEAYYDL